MEKSLQRPLHLLKLIKNVFCELFLVNGFIVSDWHY